MHCTLERSASLLYFDATFEQIFILASGYDYFHKRIHLWMGIAQHEQVEV